MAMNVIVVALLAGVCVGMVQSACYIMSQSSEQIINQFGQTVHTCTFGNETVKAGTKILTPDCMKCRCTKDGMSCCGFGVALLGVMFVDPNWTCKPVVGNKECRIRWVRRDNGKRCPKTMRGQ